MWQAPVSWEMRKARKAGRKEWYDCEGENAELKSQNLNMANFWKHDCQDE